jgi:ribonucleoside-diphosphate reductase alpha chain
MMEKGFPHEPDVMKPDHTMVFSFPIKAPNNSVFRNDMSAVEQLEIWKVYRDHYCDHNPSVTITVREHEWMDVGAWVYRHFDEMTGVSFLPHADHTYRQAPYEEIDKAAYEVLQAAMPKDVDWLELATRESTDMTEGTQSLACTSGGCDIL